MYIKAAKYSVASAALGLGLHFFSHSYVSLERTAANHLSATKAALVSGLAEDFGYERKIELEQHTLEDLAEKEALIAGINPSLVRAVMHVESRGKEFAESPVGAIGPMQVMPFNARRCELPHYSKLWTPELNVKCGVRILAEELRTYRGNIISALKVYNGGPKCLKARCNETENYVPAVLSAMAADIR